jgi:hypothetical protein
MSKSQFRATLFLIITGVLFSIYLLQIQPDFSEDIQSKNSIVDKNFYDFINNSIQNERSISSYVFGVKILNDSELNLDICGRHFSSIKAELVKTEIAKSILINPFCLTSQGGMEIWFNYKTPAEYSNIRSEIFNVFNNLSQKYNTLNLNIKRAQPAFYIHDLFYKHYQWDRAKLYGNQYINVLNETPRNLLLNNFNSNFCDVNFSTINDNEPIVSILSLSGAQKLKKCSDDVEASINSALDYDSKIKVVPYEFNESTKYLTSRETLTLALVGFFLLTVIYFFMRLFRESDLK